MSTACWDCGYKGNEDTVAVEELTVSTWKNTGFLVVTELSYDQAEKRLKGYWGTCRLGHRIGPKLEIMPQLTLLVPPTQDPSCGH